MHQQADPGSSRGSGIRVGEDLGPVDVSEAAVTDGVGHPDLADERLLGEPIDPEKVLLTDRRDRHHSIALRNVGIVELLDHRSDTGVGDVGRVVCAVGEGRRAVSADDRRVVGRSAVPALETCAEPDQIGIDLIGKRVACIVSVELAKRVQCLNRGDVLDQP